MRVLTEPNAPGVLSDAGDAAQRALPAWQASKSEQATTDA
jgi:hypothetical protein